MDQKKTAERCSQLADDNSPRLAKLLIVRELAEFTVQEIPRIFHPTQVFYL